MGASLCVVIVIYITVVCMPICNICMFACRVCIPVYMCVVYVLSICVCVV